jgi:hypothetical protein
VEPFLRHVHLKGVLSRIWPSTGAAIPGFDLRLSTIGDNADVG